MINLKYKHLGEMSEHLESQGVNKTDFPSLI